MPLKRRSSYTSLPEGRVKDECLDINSINGKAWRERPWGRLAAFHQWTVFFLMGIFTGFLAFFMEQFEGLIVDSKWDLA
jgi:hypothetical protein